MQEINGDPALVAIERAIHELRCGRVIGCCRSGPFDTSQAGDVLVASAETASAALIARLEELAGEHGLALAITRERADTLGVRAPDGYGNEDGALLLRCKNMVNARLSIFAHIEPSIA